MIKTLETNACYSPSKRSANWIKLKKDYLENSSLGDSLDLAVIGANYGSGKRKGLFGAFLVASYNEDSGLLEALCLVGTGFSEKQLNDFHEKLRARVTQQRPEDYVVHRNFKIDVWFERGEVWEIKGADLQVSPVYKCAFERLNQNGRGLGLRFPRFVRERGDKGVEQASRSQQIEQMYWDQNVVKKRKN